MALKLRIQVILIWAVSSIVLGSYVPDIWRNRQKRSPTTPIADQKTTTLPDDNADFSIEHVERYFPRKQFLKTVFRKTDIEKRSRITENIQDFDDDTDAALIVVNADPTFDEMANKKSKIVKKVERAEDGGFNIVLNNNGQEENEKKKNEIFREVEDNSESMDETFGDFIKNPPKHKRIRVIVITPAQNDQQGNERDKLPEPDSLDNLAEVSKGHLVLSENEGNDNTERILSDSLRKTELEIDIDKLKHVKEKLKLLNEDDGNEQGHEELKFKNNPKKIIKIVTKESIKVPKDARNNVNSSIDDVKSISSYDKTVLTETAHEIQTKIVQHNDSRIIDKSPDSNMSRDSHNVSNFHEIEKSKDKQTRRNEKILDHEVKFLPQNNVSTTVSNKAKESVTVPHKIADDTVDSNDRKHEISNKEAFNELEYNPNSAIFETHLPLMKPPGNPSPDDSADLMTQQKPLVFENPTKSSTILSDGDLTKKEKTVKFSNKAEPTLKATNKPTSRDTTTTTTTTTATTTTMVTPAVTTTIYPNPSPKKEGMKNNTKVLTKSDNITSSVYDKQNSNNDDSNVTKAANREGPTSSTVPQNRIIDKRKAEAIIEFMNKDPLETWRYHFNTLKSLDLNSTILRSGLVNAGNIDRLKGVMRRALEGKDITLSVVGGSISAGGGLYKDRGNIDGLYYKGVADWWNRMISPLTGSDMVINNIAIGSIGTDYFSYCVKNHIVNETDIILWELSANDFNRYKTQATKGARPLERLTRMILELPNKPALLYVNFFKGIDYKTAKSNCPNFEDQGEEVIAHYYKIPSLSWRAMVCGGLVRRDPGYSIENLFSQDQYHPSLRGHAQMSLLLLLHLRHVMRAVLQWAIAHDGYIERFEDQTNIPEPLFMGPKYPEPLCWTMITADLSDKITNSLDVRVVKDNGFKLEYATNFPIRFDKVICWKAEVPSAELTLQFNIPRYYDSAKTIKRSRSKIAVTTHTRWGGSSTLWIDDQIGKSVTIKEGRPNDPGKRTQVDYIAEDIEPGFHTLNIRSYDGGFCLAALMIDGT